MDFEEWMARNYSGDFDMPHPREAYEAGQQSKQAEIDAIIKWVEENKKSIPLSEWHGYTTEEYVDADDLLELLK